MGKPYEHGGAKFEIDDSEGCYLKVTYNSYAGYVGVNLSTTRGRDAPFCWFSGGNADRYVTKDGMTRGNSNGNTLRHNLDALCDALLREERQNQALQEFKPEEACEEMHRFVAEL